MKLKILFSIGPQYICKREKRWNYRDRGLYKPAPNESAKTWPSMLPPSGLVKPAVLVVRLFSFKINVPVIVRNFCR
jgi:hypothetical protein